MQDPLPNQEKFDLKFAQGTPLMEEVEKICAATGRDVQELEDMTMGQVYVMAKTYYGDDLPPFWNNWAAWNEPGHNQPMGDL
jgi:hypothetical protein